MDKLNVAIADDNEIMLQMLDHIVSSDEELQVVGKAGDGEELIEIIREKKPDVVLLDIIMPKLDGLTVMDRVNQDKDLKKPAFIVISAVSQEKMTEDVFDHLTTRRWSTGLKRSMRVPSGLSHRHGH